MKTRRRMTLTGLGALGLVAGSLTVAPPASAVDNVGWNIGPESITSKRFCLDLLNCFDYAPTLARVNFQGPMDSPTGANVAGKRFYLHVMTATLDSPWNIVDSYRMSLLLPEGLKVDIRSNTDVECLLSDLSFNFKRFMTPAECQDPVKSGVYDVFPAVSLSEGEIASFFVPVIADRQLTNPTIGLVSDLVNNPVTLLPDPMYATNKALVVGPAPVVTDPGTGTGTGTDPGTGTGTLPGSGGGGTTPGGTSPGGTAPAPTPGTTSGATAVRAKAISKKSKLQVKVTPDLGAGKQWQVSISARKGKAWKRLPKTYTTNKGAVTVDLKKGQYRATVVPAHGYSGSTSGVVSLKR